MAVIHAVVRPHSKAKWKDIAIEMRPGLPITIVLEEIKRELIRRYGGSSSCGSAALQINSIDFFDYNKATS
jgi:hypothetical protein